MATERSAKCASNASGPRIAVTIGQLWAPPNPLGRSRSAGQHPVHPGKELVRQAAGRAGGRLLALARPGRRRGIPAGPRGQVFVDGLVAELCQQVEATALVHEPGYGAPWLSQVAEVARARWAGAHAGWDAVFLCKVFVVNPVDAQRALLHDAVAVVIFARAIGAGPRAQLAADAGLGVDQHDAVLGTLEGRPRGAHGDARRLLAMQARAREVHRTARRTLAYLVAVHTVEPGAVRIRAVGVLIGE